MADSRPIVRHRHAAALIGLAAGFLTVLVACSPEKGSTGTTAATAAAGGCHVICSDATSSHGAAAVSPSALVCGVAVNQSTEARAKDGAVAACGRPDCVAVVWGDNGVVSVAVNNVAYGWGWAQDASKTADARAVANCQSRTP
ncbi:MAG TPA: DUF4189 domain-containing protein [Vicinamibacteria bacterium]|nr:DUF4189 domain-containing protein [Vicinamibacteria bacterium]